MIDVNGNAINEANDIGTTKYNLKINNRYLVRFKETENKIGKGSYHNGLLAGLSALPSTDEIVVSDKKEDAKVIDGKTNLKSIITKLLSDWNYKFYNIEIIEIMEDKQC